MFCFNKSWRDKTKQNKKDSPKLDDSMNRKKAAWEKKLSRKEDPDKESDE